MTALTRALAPAAVLLTLLAAGCASSGSGSTAVPPATTPSTPAATPVATTAAATPIATSPSTPVTSTATATTAAASPAPQGGPAGTDVFFAQALDVHQAAQQPSCAAGCPVSGDGTTSLWHMTWATWNGTTAVGTGTEEIDNCQPNCAAGHGAAVKVVVTFSHPVKDCADGGKWFWTQASFSWPNGLPVVLSGANTPKNPLVFSPLNFDTSQSCS